MPDSTRSASWAPCWRDTFYVYCDTIGTGSVQRIYGAGVKLQKLLNIEQLQVLTGGGDDTVYLYGVDMGTIGDMLIKTGSGSDTIIVGGPEQVISQSFPNNIDLFYTTVPGYDVQQDHRRVHPLGRGRRPALLSGSQHHGPHRALHRREPGLHDDDHDAGVVRHRGLRIAGDRSRAARA